jgi:hypothetical protein
MPTGVLGLPCPRERGEAGGEAADPGSGRLRCRSRRREPVRRADGLPLGVRGAARACDETRSGGRVRERAEVQCNRARARPVPLVVASDPPVLAEAVGSVRVPVRHRRDVAVPPRPLDHRDDDRLRPREVRSQASRCGTRGEPGGSRRARPGSQSIIRGHSPYMASQRLMAATISSRENARCCCFACATRVSGRRRGTANGVRLSGCEVVGIDLREPRPLVRDRIAGEHGIHRTGLHTGIAVDAHSSGSMCRCSTSS